ncbi:hypothetical protein PLESTB_001115300 [Pleodorina starrii]|uniref:Metallo-beta-lactamase domain-containing protein n=1 Tax=Pleodorina starrii TaxID=330485 RepID=A0A9W6BS46_9CHLO|nr:hypothetical protein PLESTM_001352100 [Pleodorina starrii]GLC56511.1 hypothetical protein PLESTB_001115300 [Pleodorina starrii]GLC68755.1 hypothetical protein PLESTF_000733300 [Pleodorina starrii]
MQNYLARELAALAKHPVSLRSSLPKSRKMLQSIARALKEQKHPPAQPQQRQEANAGADGVGTSGGCVPVLNPPAMSADSRQNKITVCGMELEGVSISGQETSIIFPRAKVTFDIGRCPQRACFQQTVLLSHTHLDHVGGLPFHVCTREMLSLPPSRVLVPEGCAAGVRRLVDVARELQGSPPLDFEVVELLPGEDHLLPSGYLCRCFRTSHPIMSQGYVLYSQRRKLKAELVGKSQEEIRQLRLAGEDVTDTVTIPEIAFTGDTTAAFLDGPASPTLEDALRARVLVMEMTFLCDDVTVDEAREKGHMHIADFVAHAHRFQNEAIVLIHFSPRYKRTDIVSALNTMLPPTLMAKCVPLLNGIE